MDNSFFLSLFVVAFQVRMFVLSVCQWNYILYKYQLMVFSPTFIMPSLDFSLIYGPPFLIFLLSSLPMFIALCLIIIIFQDHFICIIFFTLYNMFLIQLLLISILKFWILLFILSFLKNVFKGKWRTVKKAY